MGLKDTWIPQTNEDYIKAQTINDLANAIIQMELEGSGIVPSISVEEEDNGYKFIINDGKGNREEVNIYNGSPGAKGESGMPRNFEISSRTFVDPIPVNSQFNVSVTGDNILQELRLNLEVSKDDTYSQQWGINFRTSPEGFTFHIMNIGGLELKWVGAEPVFEPGKIYVTMFMKVGNFLFGTWAEVIA